MSGQTRSFASVEPHASFTLTSGHPRPQSVHPIVKVAQGDRAGKERTTTAAQLHRNVSAIFLESVLGKFRIGASANRHRRPRDVGDGRWSGGQGQSKAARGWTAAMAVLLDLEHLEH
jgi:hypothetical protein